MNGWENIRGYIESDMKVEPHARNPNLSRGKANRGVILQFNSRDEIGCFKCGHRASYNFEFDSNYCDNCNEWLEGTCKDADCPFCPNRPKYPKYPE